MIAPKGDEEFYIMRSNDLIEGPPASLPRRAWQKTKDLAFSALEAVIDGLDDAIMWWLT